MTITANDRRKNYDGNGVATTFNGPRAFSAGHLQVFVGFPPTLSPVGDDQYTVKGVGGKMTQVVFNTAPADGTKVLILRTLPLDQPTDITNQGAFLPEIHEDAFDYRVMQAQQLGDGLELSLKFPENLFPVPSTVMPSPDPSKLIGWNYDGTGLRNTDVEGGGDLLLRSDLADPTGGGTLVAFQRAGANATEKNLAVKAAETLSLSDWLSPQAALNAAGGAPLLAPPGYSVTLSSRPANPLGSRIDGPGEILVPAPGGTVRVNTEVDVGKVCIGKEHRSRLYARMNTGAGVPITCHVWGDSTAATAANGGGYAGDANSPAQLLPRLARARGLKNRLQVFNHAIGGTSWYQAATNPVPPLSVLGPSTDWFIFKYGINDVSRGLVQFAADVDASLSAIRSATYGDPTSLTITIIGPNSTYDATTGRNATWHEKARNVLMAAARKHSCVYFDAYTITQDSRLAASAWLDDPYSNGNGIHPLYSAQNWIWGAMFDEHFGFSETVPWRYNHFNSTDSNAESADPGLAASSYDFGLTMQRAQTASGFQIDGGVLTVRQGDGIAWQINFGYAAGSSRLTMRTWNVSGAAWNPWSGRAVPLSLVNGWLNFGSGFRDAVASKTIEGVVTIEGVIKSGTVTAGTLLFTLPSGFAPSGTLLFPVTTNAGSAHIRIQPSGAVEAQTALDSTFTSLCGISFLAG